MLTLNQILVKEHVGLFKLSDAYDLINPETGKKVGIAQEKVSGLIQFLRFLLNKQMLPTSVVFVENPDEHGNGKVVLAIERGFTFISARVKILLGGTEEIGYFKSKLFSIGGGFRIFDKNDRKIGEVKGDWKGWNFKILDDEGKELGLVTKKWAGLGKEFFTSADTYMISINPGKEGNRAAMSLLLAAGIAIDTVFKEK